MLVNEAMSRDVRIVSPGQTIQDAAKIMLEIDAGALPVGENDKLVGMITDRDIAVRAIGAGKPPTTRVVDVMTKEIKYCFDDEDTAHVGRNMGEQQVRRLPVLDDARRPVGIITLGDIARCSARGDAELEHEVLRSFAIVSRPCPPATEPMARAPLPWGWQVSPPAPPRPDSCKSDRGQTGVTRPVGTPFAAAVR